MKKLVFLIAVLGATSAQANEMWMVQEGAGPSVGHGTWHVTVVGDVLSGGGTMAVGKSTAETFGFTGKLNANGYVIQRASANAGSACIYQGKATHDGRSIAGSVTCAGKSLPWFVTVNK